MPDGKIDFESKFQVRSGTARQNVTVDNVLVTPGTFHVKLGLEGRGAVNLEPREVHILIGMLQTALITQTTVEDAAD
jgi:hypothetical protein